MTESIRVGILVDSAAIPAWQRSLVERLAAETHIELAVFATGSVERRWSGLAAVYERLDHRHYRLPNDALAAAELPDGVSVSPVLAMTVSDLDVVVRLSAYAMSAAPRFGVWSVRSDGEILRAVYDGAAVVDTVVELWKPELGTRVIYRSSSRTEPLSVYRNRHLAYWKAAEAIVRRLETLHRLGFDALPKETIERRSSTPPGPVTVARLAGRVAARDVRLRRRMRSVEEQWCIAHRRRGEASYRTISPPDGRFHADPFLIARDGRHHLFFEDYGREEGKGAISHVELRDGDLASDPQRVLERPYHLSYPFVFESGGEIWMVPETAANRTIELYRATRFPHKWELERVLVSGVHALDSTVLFHEGRFWIFTLVNPYGLRANSELHLYWSNSLDGRWTAHPLNPVVSDVRSARPAGRVQLRDGRLIRLGQDSGERYGHAIAMKRIELLTESDYRESPAGRMTADLVPGSVAMHTYDTDGTYEVVDALRATTR